ASNAFRRGAAYGRNHSCRSRAIPERDGGVRPRRRQPRAAAAAHRANRGNSQRDGTRRHQTSGRNPTGYVSTIRYLDRGGAQRILCRCRPASTDKTLTAPESANPRPSKTSEASFCLANLERGIIFTTKARRPRRSASLALKQSHLISLE